VTATDWVWQCVSDADWVSEWVNQCPSHQAHSLTQWGDGVGSVTVWVAEYGSDCECDWVRLSLNAWYYLSIDKCSFRHYPLYPAESQNQNVEYWSSELLRYESDGVVFWVPKSVKAFLRVTQSHPCAHQLNQEYDNVWVAELDDEHGTISTMYY